MVRLSEIVATLTSAWVITQEEVYASHALEHLMAWFVDAPTRMTPNLLYGQAIKGRVTGRSIGIIDTAYQRLVFRLPGLVDHSPLWERGKDSSE
jgi:hypothetical protein